MQVIVTILNVLTKSCHFYMFRPPMYCLQQVYRGYVYEYFFFFKYKGSVGNKTEFSEHVKLTLIMLQYGEGDGWSQVGLLISQGENQL